MSGEVIGKKVDCLMHHMRCTLSCWQTENSCEIHSSRPMAGSNNITLQLQSWNLPWLRERQ